MPATPSDADVVGAAKTALEMATRAIVGLERTIEVLEDKLESATSELERYQGRCRDLEARLKAIRDVAGQ